MHYNNQILSLLEDISFNHHLIMYIQPKFCLNSPNPSRAEVLVRIMDENGRLMKPADFLPALEKNEVSYKLDLMVIENILKILLNWHQKGLALIPVSINLSTSDFFSNEFMRIFKEIMQKYSNIQKYLEFEISADTYFANPEYITQMIHKLQGYSCRVSLDNFGKDCLAVSTLEIPSVDMVEFDQSFLQTARKSSRSILIMKKFAEIFEGCNVPVLLKGIETYEDEELTRKCGISYVQGFYYGRPVPFDIFQRKYMYRQSVILS